MEQILILHCVNFFVKSANIKNVKMDLFEEISAIKV